MLTILSIIIIILLLTICVSLFYIFKFGRIILNIEECIEEAIAGLDESYNKISDILEKPVFFDSQEVRQTIDEIAAARNLIFGIAEKLTASVIIENRSEESANAQNNIT